MKRPVILPYHRTSISAKAVSRFFKTLRPFPNRNYKPRHNDIIINWGFNNEIPVLEGTNTEVLNRPENIRKASSKLECLIILNDKGIPVPEFATNIEDAKALFDNTGIVYCRTLTRASKGKGIILATRPEDLVKAPLYTAKLDNHIEYRVHIFNNTIIDIVQKRKMTKERMADKGIGQRNDDIRNLMNGWSFTRGAVTIKDKNGNYYFDLIEIALEAAKDLNLDFCAIDLIKTSADDFYVLEINTAPGMKPGTTTHRRYVKAIAEYCDIPFSDADFTKRYDIENSHEDNLSQFLNEYDND